MDGLAETAEGGFANAKKADSLLFDGVEAQQLQAHVRAKIFGEADPVRIGRYTVLERIGAGGMGVVYAAFDNKLDRKIALKLMRRRDPATHARTLREAKAMARLSHPNVVQVHDVGEWRDRVFIAMEFVRGVTLGQWRTQVRDPARLLETLLQAGAGLAAAHDAGIVHRDFKSDNILVASDGRARVVDFGIARTELGERAPTADYARVDVDLTATGTVVGTPAYMAPEQFVGESVDARADQWAFGVVVHETLAGARPFDAPDFAALREAVLAGKRAPTEAKLPPQVARVIERALQRDPEQRYPSMVALLMDLRPARGRALPILVVGLIAALLFVVGLLTFRWKFGDAQLSESRAEVAKLARRAEGAERTISERDDALALRQAREALHADPTYAIQALGALSPAGWNDEARCLLAEAQMLGIADTIWADGRKWPEAPTLDTGVLLRRDRDRNLVVIDPVTLQETPLAQRHALVSADGAIVSTCDLEELWLFDAEGDDLGRLTLPEDFRTYLVAAGGRAVGVTTPGELRTYALPGLEPIATIPLSDAPLEDLQAVAPDGRSAFALRDGTLLHVDAEGARPFAEAERGPVRTSANGRWISAVENDQGDIVVWDAHGEPVANFHEVERYAFSPGGDRIAVATFVQGEDVVRLRDLAGKSSHQIVVPSRLDALQFSSDGRWLAALAAGKLTVWETQTGFVMPSTWRSSILAFRIDAAAGTLVALDAQGLRVRWNLEAHRIESVAPDGGSISALTFDGPDVVSGSTRGTIARWEPGASSAAVIADEDVAVVDLHFEDDSLGVGLGGGGAVFFEGTQERGRIPGEPVSRAVVVDPVEMVALRSRPTSIEVIRPGAAPVKLHECPECTSTPDRRVSISDLAAYKHVERGADLVAMQFDESALLWRPGDRAPTLLELHGERHHPSRDGSVIANASWEGMLVITDTEGERVGGILGAGVDDVLHHGVAGHTLLELTTGDLAWWRAEVGAPCGLGRRFRNVTSGAVSPDEREIALGLRGGRVARFPMPSGLTTEDPAGLVASLQPTTITRPEAP